MDPSAHYAPLAQVQSLPVPSPAPGAPGAPRYHDIGAFAAASASAAPAARGKTAKGGLGGDRRRTRGVGSVGEFEDDGLPDDCVTKVVRSETFTYVVGGVILLNTLSMALETNYPEMRSLWKAVNGCFLLFFVCELASRLYTFRCTFFYNEDRAWNIFDFLIVGLSLIDFIVAEVASSAAGSNKTPIGRYVMLLRILRILRILRLVHAAPQLMMLVRGVMESMQLVVWIMLMLFMLMLVFAIFITEQVGNNAYLKDEQGNYVFENPESIKKYWGGVITSWITLFQFLTLDDWASISHEVAVAPGYWWMQLVFDAYVMIAAFAMLSLLTGVIADHMSEVSASEKAEEKKKADNKLNDVFENWMSSTHLEQDFVNYQQFRALFEHQEVGKKLEELGAGVDSQELEDFWNFLDRDNDGRLSTEELRHGLVRLRGELQSKDMLRMRCAAERVAERLTPDSGPEGSRKKLKEVDECMDKIEVKMSEMTEQLTGFIEYMSQR